MTDEFADILGANQEYVAGFTLGDLSAPAARGLAVVTCIDSRIEPLAMLGLVPGDAKIIRNAGARVTDDTLRSLVLSVHLLNVSRIALIAHTNCKMTEATDAELRVEIAGRTGLGTDEWVFHAVVDQQQALVDDLALIRGCPLIPATVLIGGFVYDVTTGALTLETTA